MKTALAALLAAAGQLGLDLPAVPAPAAAPARARVAAAPAASLPSLLETSSADPNPRFPVPEARLNLAGRGLAHGADYYGYRCTHQAGATAAQCRYYYRRYDMGFFVGYDVLTVSVPLADDGKPEVLWTGSSPRFGE